MISISKQNTAIRKEQQEVEVFKGSTLSNFEDFIVQRAFIAGMIFALKQTEAKLSGVVPSDGAADSVPSGTGAPANIAPTGPGTEA